MAFRAGDSKSSGSGFLELAFPSGFFPLQANEAKTEAESSTPVWSIKPLRGIF